MVAPGDRRHPAEDALLAYARKHLIFAASVRDLANWIKREYPASAPALVPPLRQVFKDCRAREEREKRKPLW